MTLKKPKPWSHDTMKKIALLSLLLIAGPVWAKCQHAHLPSKQVMAQPDYVQVRTAIMKKGWMPNPSQYPDAPLYNPDMPEKECGASSCSAFFHDQRGNTLILSIDDNGSHPTLSCKP